MVNLLYCKGLVDVAHTVAHQFLGLGQLGLAVLIGVLDKLLHATLAQQLHGGPEHAELL